MTVGRWIDALIDAFPRWSWGIAASLCGLAIILMGQRPAEQLGSLGSLPAGFDKLLHFFAFAGFTALLCRWLILDVREWPRALPRWRWIIVLAIVAIIGATDEVLQGLADRGRAGTVADWIADFSGGFMVTAYAALRRREALRWLRRR